jgi:hypothetical protein
MDLPGLGVDAARNDGDSDPEDHAPGVEGSLWRRISPRHAGEQAVDGHAGQGRHTGRHQALPRHSRKLARCFQRASNVKQVLASCFDAGRFHHAGPLH